MSDNGSETDDIDGKDGPPQPASVTRRPAVTDTLDSIFGVLRKPRCRFLLYYLFTMDGEVAEFDAAVNAVYQYETAGKDGATDNTRDQIRIELQHCHLPRLADEEIIDYDPRHGTIRFTGEPVLEEWVEHARYKELD